MSTNQAAFVVEGEWFTNLVRSLWADEGQPEKAMRLLKTGIPDLPEEAAYGILRGTKRLDGDSTTGLDLVDDSATESPCGNSLALEAVLKPLRTKAEEGRDATALLAGQVTHIGSPKGRVAIPTHRIEAYRRGEIGLDDMLYRGVSNIPTAEERKAMLTDPMVEVERQRRGIEPLDDEEGEPLGFTPPPPAYKITHDYGWLSPDGKFYPCAWMEHIWLAGALGFEERNLEKLGWIKIEAGEAFAPEREVTQRQIDLVFDWYQTRGKELPFWWEKP